MYSVSYCDLLFLINFYDPVSLDAVRQHISAHIWTEDMEQGPKFDKAVQKPVGNLYTVAQRPYVAAQEYSCRNSKLQYLSYPGCYLGYPASYLVHSGNPVFRLIS